MKNQPFWLVLPDEPEISTTLQLTDKETFHRYNSLDSAMAEERGRGYDKEWIVKVKFDVSKTFPTTVDLFHAINTFQGGSSMSNLIMHLEVLEMFVNAKTLTKISLKKGKK